MAASTFRNILEPALRKAKVTQHAGIISGTDKVQETLDAMNRITDSLNIQQLAIYETQIQTFNLTPNHNPHTWGIGGDFNSARPIQIDFCNLIMTTASPNYRIPLQIWTKDVYERIAIPSQKSTYPEGFYPDSANPMQSLYFYPVATAAYPIEFFTWLALKNNFTAATDTFVFPPGYEKDFVDLLAVEMSMIHENTLNDADFQRIQKSANASLEAVNRNNEIRNPLTNDFGGNGRPDFNYRTGMGTRFI